MTDDPQFPEARPRKKLVISFDDEPSAPPPTTPPAPPAPAPRAPAVPAPPVAPPPSLWSSQGPPAPPAPRVHPAPEPTAWPPPDAAPTQPLAPPPPFAPPRQYAPPQPPAPPQWPSPSPVAWAPQPMAGPRSYASWGLRFVATLIDGALSMIVVFVVMLLVGVSAFGLASGTDEETAGAAGFLAGLLAYVLVSVAWGLVYAPLTMMRRGPHNGQTLGKQLVNIRVMRMDGTPVTAGTAIMRDVVMKNFVIWGLGSFFFAIPGILSSLWPLWDGQRQTWHDKAVSTVVTNA